MAAYPQNTGVFVAPPTGIGAPPLPGAGEGVGLEDYLRSAWSRAVQLPAVVPAAARLLEGEPETEWDKQNLAANQFMQERLRGASADVVAGMSPDAQRLLNATVASRDFWSQPFAWTGLQLAGTVPDVAAAVVAGAVSGGTIPALLAAGAASGTLSAGDFLDTAQRSVDERSDQQLRTDSPLYRDMREQGMPEVQARARMQRDMVKYQIPVLFALGTATGALGVPGQVTKALGVGGTRAAARAGGQRGLARRVGEETATGAGTEFVQSAGESLAAQTAAVTAGFQPHVSISEALIAGAGGALPGGVLGGITGLRPDVGAPPAPPPAAGPAALPSSVVQPDPRSPPAALPPAGAPRVPPGPRRATTVQEEPIARAPLVTPYPGAVPATPKVVAKPADKKGLPPETKVVRRPVPDLNAPQPSSAVVAPYAPERLGSRLGAPEPTLDTPHWIFPEMGAEVAALPVGRRPGDPPRNYDPMRGVVVETGPSVAQRTALAQGQNLDLFGQPYAGEPQGALQGGLTTTPIDEQALRMPGPSLLPSPDAEQPLLPLRDRRPAPPVTPPRPDATQMPLPGMEPPSRGGPGGGAPPAPPGGGAPPPAPLVPTISPGGAAAPIPRERALVPGAAARPLSIVPTEHTYPRQRDTQLSLFAPGDVGRFLLDRSGWQLNDFMGLADFFAGMSDAELHQELARKRNQNDPADLLEHLAALMVERERLDFGRALNEAETPERGEFYPWNSREEMVQAYERVLPAFLDGLSIEAMEALEAGAAESKRQVGENLFRLQERMQRSEKAEEGFARDEALAQAEAEGDAIMLADFAEETGAQPAEFKGKKGEEWFAKRRDEDRRTVQLFQEFDDGWNPIVNPKETMATFQRNNIPRLASILEEAKKRDIKIRNRVGHATSRPESVWLRHVEWLHELLTSGQMNEEKRQEVIAFYGMEAEARRGNWKSLLDWRREGGARRKGQTPSIDQVVTDEEGASAIDPRLQGQAGQRGAGMEGATAEEQAIEQLDIQAQLEPIEAAFRAGEIDAETYAEQREALEYEFSQYEQNAFQVPGGFTTKLPADLRPEPRGDVRTGVFQPPLPEKGAKQERGRRPKQVMVGRISEQRARKPAQAGGGVYGTAKYKGLSKAEEIKASAEEKRQLVLRQKRRAEIMEEAEKRGGAQAAEREEAIIRKKQPPEQKTGPAPERGAPQAFLRSGIKVRGVDTVLEETPADRVEEAAGRLRTVLGEIKDGKVKLGAKQRKALEAELDSGEYGLQSLEALKRALVATKPARTPVKPSRPGAPGVAVTELAEISAQLEGEARPDDTQDALYAAQTFIEALRDVLPTASKQRQNLDQALATLADLAEAFPERSKTPSALRSRRKRVLEAREKRLAKARAEAEAQAAARPVGELIDTPAFSQVDAILALSPQERERVMRTLTAGQRRQVMNRLLKGGSEPYTHPRHAELVKTPLGRAELEGAASAGDLKAVNPFYERRAGKAFIDAWEKGRREARAEQAAIERGQRAAAAREAETRRADEAVRAAQRAGRKKRAAEEAKIDKLPSPAQLREGNFQKGHLSINGLRISLEVGRRGLRKLKSGLQVRTKWAYGYFLGTESTDGEQLDVYLGPHAYPGSPQITRQLKEPGRVVELPNLPATGRIDKDLKPSERYPAVVISQLNIAGGFDENKVMLGFDTVEDALNAYAETYPGVGRARIHSWRPMTMPEFKRWMASPRNVKRPVSEAWEATPMGRSWQRGTLFGHSDLSGLTNEEIEALFPTPDPDEAMQTLLDQQAAERLAAAGIEPVPFSSLTLEEPFDGVLAAFPENLRASAKRVLDRVRVWAADTPTYMLDRATFSELFPDKPFSNGFFNPEGNLLVIAREPWGPVETNIPVHEAGHAALLQAIHVDPKVERALSRILEAAQDHAETLGRAALKQYGLNDIDEMVSELISNRPFAEFLQGVRSPLGNLFKRLWRRLGRALGLLSDADISVLPDIMRRLQLLQRPTGPMTDAEIARVRASGQAPRERLQRLKDRHPSFDEQHARMFEAPGPRRSARDLADIVGTKWEDRRTGVPSLISLYTNDGLAQLGKTIPGTPAAFNQGTRALSNAVEQTRVDADEMIHEQEPLLTKFYQLQHAWRGRPEWERLITLMHDTTMYGAHPDRGADQFGKFTVRNRQAREQLPRLAATFNALPDALRQAYVEARDLYETLQRRQRDELAKNRLAAIAPPGKLTPAVLERILDGEETQADIDALGQDVIDDIYEVHAVSTVQGPYFPFIRRGDWVVNARYRLKPPTAGLQGRLVDDTDNVFEFRGDRAKEHAEHYAGLQELKTFARALWVDAATGSEYVRDSDGKEVRVSKADANAEQRWRVRVQNQHTEFFDTRRAAEARKVDLDSKPELFTDVRGVEAKQYRKRGWFLRGEEGQLENQDFDRVVRRLQKNERFLALTPAAQKTFLQSLRQAALQSLGATRMTSRRMPRGYVEGASRDFVLNMHDYAQASVSHLANLRHAQAAADAIKLIGENVQGDDKVGTAARSRIANELIERFNTATERQEPGKADGFIRRMAQLAFTYFLASPAYSMNNLLQTIMVTLPHLSGVYGPGVAGGELYKAYGDIAAPKMLLEGLKATGRRILGEPGMNAVERMIAEADVSDVERRMLRRLQKLGSLGGETGIEIARLIRSPEDTALGKFDRVLHYMTEVAREFPRLSEAINRSATALTTFRAELRRNGGDVEAATLKAQEVTNLTQGLYSASDAAPVFNTPAGQLMLVFRKFGQLMYQYLFLQAGRAIRDAEPGDRQEALKSLGYMAAMTVAMAGSLGFPTDQFKALLIGLNALGLDLTWGDVEYYQRELNANLFGAKAGEALSRGLPRLLGIDLSQRVGYSGLLLHGEPRTYDDDYPFYAWIGEIVAGAPAGMAADMVQGVNKMTNGDFAAGAQAVLPFKLGRDLIHGGREMTEGVKTAAGYQVEHPASLVDGFIRGMGYTPAHAAETTEARNYFFRTQQELTKERNKFLHKWNEASGSERSRLWLDIVQWNRGQEPGVRLTRADLNDYKKRRRTQKEERGIILNKVNEPLFERMQAGPYPNMALQ